VAAPHHFTVAGGYLYFVGYERLAGYSLWRCDGTVAESIKAFGWNKPASLTAVGDEVFFCTQDALWKSNGIEPGTTQIATVKVEADPMQPLCVWNDAVFFAAYDPNSGIELWISKGTDTHLIRDIAPGRQSALIPNLKAMPNGVVFSTTTGPDQACLWLTKGTEQDTQCLADFSTSDGSPLRLHQFRRFMGRSLYFLANDRLLRYKSTTGEILEPVGCDGSVPPDNILYITTTSDKLIIITDAGDAGQGLWLYGSEY
jgi:ELWxxDGT repeat protein